MNKESSGCIYTKTWVAKYMLDIAGYTSDKDLAKIKIVEPSCGEGKFVCEIIERLCISARTYGIPFCELKDSFAAFDINEPALNETKNAAKKILANYLCEDEVCNKLLEQWFQNMDFIDTDLKNVDLVVGNPPYIRARDITENLKKKYMDLLKTFTKGTDIYIAFFEKGLKILNDKGKLIYICSDRWQKNQFGKKLRRLIKENFNITFNCIMHDIDVFEQKVAAYPAITMIERTGDKSLEVMCGQGFNYNDACSVVKIVMNEKTDKSGNFIVRSLTANRVEEACKFPYLEEAGIKLGIGLATGKDNVFVISDTTLVEMERLLPLAYAKDIHAYRFPESPTRWLVNPWNEDGSLVDIHAYPLFEKYMLRHKNELSARHISRKYPDNWYRTIDKVKPDLFRKEKLLIRDIENRPEPILEQGILYPHHNLYWITSDSWDIEALGGLLLSDTIAEMMKRYSIKMRGGVIRNQVQYLKKLRIPKVEELCQSDINGLKCAFKCRDRERATKLADRIYGGV